MNNGKKALALFRQFFLFGCFTFGGGWSIIAQIEKKYVREEESITKEELLDIISVGRSLPGIMVTNVTFLFGHHMAGIAGGIAAVAGIALAPILILMGVTQIYNLLEGQPLMDKAMAGVRAAVVPIILSSVYRLWSGAFKYPACYAVFALCFCLYFFLHMGVIVLVLLGGVCGILLCEVMERREAL